MSQPFSVESSDIQRLSDKELTKLLKMLLHAEAQKYNITESSIEVSLNINVSDDGEDGRIEWEGGPSNTSFIPNRLTMFQNKAANMGPADYANEILTTKGDVKRHVDEVLTAGGAYIVFTTQELNKKQKVPKRVQAIRDQLKTVGKAYYETADVRIYDAAQISGWVNNYTSSIIAVHHWVGRPLERGLKTFWHWSEDDYIRKYPFIEVKSREGLISQISDEIKMSKSCLRLVGLSGMGKTRLAYQAFKEYENLQSLVVYVDVSYVPNICALISDWVSIGMSAILVIDNCEYQLHEKIKREVKRSESNLSFISLDFNFDEVSAGTSVLELKKMKDEEILELLKPTYENRLSDLNRIAEFAQGFPQMAVMLAEARLNDDPNMGELTDDYLAEKLLWNSGESKNEEHLKVLSTCSLFDSFGVDGELEVQLKHISDICNVSLDAAYSCIQKYTDRGIIDRRGRFGQLVPKPLAIKLAKKWWKNNRKQKQSETIQNIPENMEESFCSQINKLDSLPEVKELVKDLCGDQGPFGQAEVILSVRGSRFFRAFTEVNPSATTSVIYKIFQSLDEEQCRSINGRVRRHLVNSLEILCFHSSYFEKAATCLFKLACAENESFSNNATGQFSQLFRVNLSGTEATPEQRFSLLEYLMKEDFAESNRVILSALECSLDRRGHRMVGSEYQGTKKPMEEWKPQIWGEVFAFWQKTFDLLLEMYSRKGLKDQVKEIIGHSIRYFVKRGRVDMLDKALRHIVEDSGHYWTAASTSIKNALEYDSEGMPEDGIKALVEWQKLLEPAEDNLEEQLKALVIDPPWDHVKDGKKFIDRSQIKAHELAVELAGRCNELIPFFSLLFSKDQRQTYSFASKLAQEAEDIIPLLDECVIFIGDQEPENLSFIRGLLNGLFVSDKDSWDKYVERFSVEEALIKFFPSVIPTGKIQPEHLECLNEFLKSKKLIPEQVLFLAYGSVLDHLNRDAVVEFAQTLAEVNEIGVWVALSIMSFYCHRNDERFFENADIFKSLTSNASLQEEITKSSAADLFVWKEKVLKLLPNDFDFSSNICVHILTQSKGKISFGALWDDVKPVLTEIMKAHGDHLWDNIGEQIVNSDPRERYRLQNLLEKKDSFSTKSPSPLNFIPSEKIIEWCKNHPEVGPKFIAKSINVFEEAEEELQPSTLFVKFMCVFGDSDEVKSYVSANMYSRSYTNSLVPTLLREREALSVLLEHENAKVKSWARETIDSIDSEIERNKLHDEERGYTDY